MKFGYMAGFRSDLLTEIKFARKHFNFIEINIQAELLKTLDDIFNDLKNALSGIEVLGHIHWGITEPNDIKNNIEIFKNLGANKITIHPFENLNIEENIRILNDINNFSQRNQVQLLIENITSAPYNSADTIFQILEKIPGAGITLDIGHANRISELDKFIQMFKSKIKHIHLHYNIGELDHIFYEDQDNLNQMLAKIKSFDYDSTILLETFSIMKDGENVSQDFPELKKLHIEQPNKIKT